MVSPGRRKPMVRTQVQFEEKQYEAIRRLAHRHRLSVAAAIRQLVNLGLREGLEPAPRKDRSALLALAGTGASGVNDLGSGHDDYLAGLYSEKAPAGDTLRAAPPVASQPGKDSARGRKEGPAPSRTTKRSNVPEAKKKGQKPTGGGNRR